MIYPRETKELQPIRVLVDDTVVTDGVKVCVNRPGVRPTVWVEPQVLLTGGLAVMINQLELGVWNIWAQVTTEDEIVVVHCGDFKII